MGLDITLRVEETHIVESTGIYVRDGGQTRELTFEEVKEKFPDVDIQTVQKETVEVWWDNITHNLTKMADAVGAYKILWRPDEIYEGEIRAKQLTTDLTIAWLAIWQNPEALKKYNPKNGWGSYETLLNFVWNYLKATVEYPNAIVEVSR